MKFLKLLKALDKDKIRYLLAGGVAVNLHGIIRPTHDIDLVVYLERKNLLKFCHLMTLLGYKPRIPVKVEELANPKKRQDWIKNKNMIVFSFYQERDSMDVVDVFIKHPLPFEPMFKRRNVMMVNDISISLINIRDLICLKEKANRLQDLSDIKALKKSMAIQKELTHAKKKK